MEWSSTIRVILSQTLFPSAGCLVAKYINILKGERKSNCLDMYQTYSITRMEIQLEISNANSISIILSKRELIWFQNQIRIKSEKSIHFNRKQKLIFNKISENIYAISSVNNKRSFGILLNEVEIKKILANEELFEFLMNNFYIDSPKLDEITCELYSAILSESILKNINKQKSSQKCCYLKYLKYNDLIFEKCLNCDQTDLEFLISFQKLMSLLNISNSERVKQIQVIYPKFKENNELLWQKVINYIDFDEGLGKIIMNILKLANSQ